MKKKLTKALLAATVGAGLVFGSAGAAQAIVGGTESATGARPYQVSLQTQGEHYCGGTIINATTIITAAHCVEGESAATTTIRAGVTDVTSSAGQDVAVASITANPTYAQQEIADIAVIKLATPLTLGGKVQAIPLATNAQIASASTGVVSGWGAVSENGDGSTNLLEATVPLVSDAACSMALDTDGPTEVCAGGTGTDSCYGDSGGPLVVNTDSGVALAGVVSWGEECGGATPGVYADIPGLTNWIASVPATGVTESPAAGNTDATESSQDTDSGDAASGDTDMSDDFDDSDFDDSDFENYDDADFGDGDFEDFDDADFWAEFWAEIEADEAGDFYDYDDADFYCDDADIWADEDGELYCDAPYFDHDDADFWADEDDDFYYDDADFWADEGDDFYYDDADFWADDEGDFDW